jgi:hypothetical protein
MKEKTKMRINSIQFNDEWYNDDCSIYDKKKVTLKSDDSIHLVEKIKELERKLKLANEV